MIKEITLRQGFTARPIPPDIEQFMRGVTYHDNPHVALSDLMYLKVLHYDFDHKPAEGELVVLGKLALEVLQIFDELYLHEYEIEKLRLCDYYKGDDELSMGDNNSSAFNYRVVADTDTLSLHALGRAIDINPLYNPYIVGDKVMPANGSQYADRGADFPHKIDHGDLCFKVFKKYGWSWGGDWQTEKDYQHFYKPEQSLLRSVFKNVKTAFDR